MVVTSDAWPHLAGVREYFAMNVPVYTNALNNHILDRVAKADYSPDPDLYQKVKRNPVYELVRNAVSIDDKKHPVKIFPINGEGGERMVAVYFPNEKILYASDLVQRSRNGEFFFPEYLAEVENLVRQQNLIVEKIYAMHTQPIPWMEVEDALKKIKQ